MRCVCCNDPGCGASLANAIINSDEEADRGNISTIVRCGAEPKNLLLRKFGSVTDCQVEVEDNRGHGRDRTKWRKSTSIFAALDERAASCSRLEDLDALFSRRSRRCAPCAGHAAPSATHSKRHFSYFESKAGPLRRARHSRPRAAIVTETGIPLREQADLQSLYTFPPPLDFSPPRPCLCSWRNIQRGEIAVTPSEGVRRTNLRHYLTLLLRSRSRKICP